MANPKGKNNRLGDAHVITPWPKHKRGGARAPRSDLGETHDHSAAGGSGLDSSTVRLDGLFLDPLALDRMIVLNDPLFRYFS